jgi:hypothetical protein
MRSELGQHRLRLRYGLQQLLRFGWRLWMFGRLRLRMPPWFLVAPLRFEKTSVRRVRHMLRGSGL